MRPDSAAKAARCPDEAVFEQRERLSELIAVRDQELRRLREELGLRDLYIEELHAVLRRQAERIEHIEQRIRRLAAGDAGSGWPQTRSEDCHHQGTPLQD